MAEINLDECYTEVLKLVEECGQIIASRNAGDKKVMEKTGDIDLLTGKSLQITSNVSKVNYILSLSETDQQVERKLIDGLLAKFPSHK